jgi:hypothetical protein
MKHAVKSTAMSACHPIAMICTHVYSLAALSLCPEQQVMSFTSLLFVGIKRKCSLYPPLPKTSTPACICPQIPLWATPCVTPACKGSLISMRTSCGCFTSVPTTSQDVKHGNQPTTHTGHWLIAHVTHWRVPFASLRRRARKQRIHTLTLQ